MKSRHREAPGFCDQTPLWKVWRQLNMTPWNCNGFVDKPKISKSGGSTQTCRSHRSWLEPNKWEKIQNAHPDPEATDLFPLEREITFFYIQNPKQGALISENYGQFTCIILESTLSFKQTHLFISSHKNKKHNALFGVSAYLAYGLDLVAKN